MTSSLVGSEMCIRDRIQAAHEQIRRGGRTDLCPHEPAWQTPEGFRPVSYTHLTLPTICSV
eukprot:9513742-Prorocentrum_lima.AAC.1